MSQVVFLDESSTNGKWHKILSVGGVIADAPNIPEIERRWNEHKLTHGLADRDLRFAMSWPSGSMQRLSFIRAIGELPLRGALIALLEDFRPNPLRRRKETRSDLYVHSSCFEYVLQRLSAPQFRPGDRSGHLVLFDHGNQFAEHDRQYRLAHKRRPDYGWPSLADMGYSESLGASASGALNEVADLLVGAVTRWAACRCGVERGKKIPEQSELDDACSALLRLFPAPSGIPRKWTGRSMIVHAKGLTGKEQLKSSLDGWLRELEKPQAQARNDDIPF